jgi:hypothetical protein
VADAVGGDIVAIIDCQKTATARPTGRKPRTRISDAPAAWLGLLAANEGFMAVLVGLKHIRRRSASDRNELQASLLAGGALRPALPALPCSTALRLFEASKHTPGKAPAVPDLEYGLAIAITLAVRPPACF